MWLAARDMACLVAADAHLQHVCSCFAYVHIVYMQVDAAAVLETVNHLIGCLLMDTPGANQDTIIILCT